MGDSKLLVSLSDIIKISFWLFVNQLKFSDQNSQVCILAASGLRHLGTLNCIFPHG